MHVGGLSAAPSSKTAYRCEVLLQKASKKVGFRRRGHGKKNAGIHKNLRRRALHISGLENLIESVLS